MSMTQLRKVLGKKSNVQALAVGCVALALGGIVLARGGSGQALPPPHTPPPRTPDTTVHATGTRVDVSGPRLHGRVSLSQGAVEVGPGRHVYAEVLLDAESARTASAPVSLAIVLDVSGSMAGQKLEDAKRAVLQLVSQMRATDRVALVTYSDHASVLQALAPVEMAGPSLRMTVPSIQPESGTNIPAGLLQGVAALERAPHGDVQRIVLLSDGQDTSGQPLEATCAEVRRRANAGVTFSGLGVGTDYDERFMSQVALSGRGNYAFLADGAQLQAFLARELRESTGTVVDGAAVLASLPRGMRLLRAFGGEAEGRDGSVRVPVGALYGGEQRRVVLELEVDSTAPGDLGALAFALEYRAVPDARDVRLEADGLALRAVATADQATASRDVEVHAGAESIVIAERQAQAVEAWRSGDQPRAARLANDNAIALQGLAAGSGSAEVRAQADVVAEQARRIAASPASAAPPAEALRDNEYNIARARGRTGQR